MYFFGNGGIICNFFGIEIFYLAFFLFYNVYVKDDSEKNSLEIFFDKVWRFKNVIVILF